MHFDADLLADAGYTEIIADLFVEFVGDVHSLQLLIMNLKSESTKMAFPIISDDFSNDLQWCSSHKRSLLNWLNPKSI